MLEREMEIGIAECPQLFIEPGLSLVRRQVVINGRRPDILFTDSLSRHLLVEVQRGQLDEGHVQRHFYYFFDYRALHPHAHLRLMFIANRIVTQHKDFLDYNGYEYREYPEQAFARMLTQCGSTSQEPIGSSVEPEEIPVALNSNVHEVLYGIEKQSMTLCYKMLLLTLMTEMADSDGRVSLRMLAEAFQDFFITRSNDGKVEENPNRDIRSPLSTRSLSSWERTIREQPVPRLTEDFLIDEGSAIRWAPRIWINWSEEMKQEVMRVSHDRLVRYFEKNVPGGF